MPRSYIGLKRQFDALPGPVRRYFKKLEPLLKDGANFDVTLAFLFVKVEEAHHRALKCGFVRLLDCDSEKVDEVLERQHFTRAAFWSVFRNVFGSEIKPEDKAKLSKAEDTRDKLMHGKRVEAGELRNALGAVFEYVVALGAFVETKTKKNPFGDLRGLVGRRETLGTTQSFWIMKGCGLMSQVKAGRA
ncbi:MAG: hypothetical protein AAGA15_15930 [Pseudomonadota bacterium]